MGPTNKAARASDRTNRRPNAGGAGGARYLADRAENSALRRLLPDLDRHSLQIGVDAVHAMTVISTMPLVKYRSGSASETVPSAIASAGVPRGARAAASRSKRYIGVGAARKSPRARRAEIGP
jgi:hypothetical protein